MAAGNYDPQRPRDSTERSTYSLQQRMSVKRLVEERNRTGLERTTPRLLVAVSRQDHDRNARFCGRQMPEQVEAAHPVHPQIEHEAAGAISLGGPQELVRRGECLDAESHRPKEITEGSTQRFVIIHD